MPKTNEGYATADGYMEIVRGIGPCRCDWCCDTADCSAINVKTGLTGELCDKCYDSFATLVREQSADPTKDPDVRRAIRMEFAEELISKYSDESWVVQATNDSIRHLAERVGE